MAPGRTTCSANVAIGFMLRALRSNKNKKISFIEFFHQVADTKVEVPKTVLEGTASQAVTRAPVEAPATKQLKKYVDTAENNFEIDLDYSLGQQMMELFDSDGESPSSTHGDGVSKLYTTTPRLKMD